MNTSGSELATPAGEAPAPIAAEVVDFIRQWSASGKSFRLSERAGAQPHFIGLCRILGVDPPEDADSYCFERGHNSASGRVRFADVWKQGCFAWEYKRPGGDLREALEQLMQYTLPLDNPPLLIVCDRLRFEIHTHFTGFPSTTIEFSADDLRDARVRQKLRAVFTDPYSFQPAQSSKQVTESAATAFASIAESLRSSGAKPQVVAHFLSQCVFCYFAEDIGLLPKNVYKRMLLKRSEGKALQKGLQGLFDAMRLGGAFGADDIAWFNGGLFNRIEVPSLPAACVDTLAEVASLNWSAIDASIFGTLFERGLDPAKRGQLGAFYTDPSIIWKIIDPVIRRPLIHEWNVAKTQISTLLSTRDYLRVRAKGISSKTEALRKRHSGLQARANKADRDAKAVFSLFLERLKNFTVLDPACGSGNFLYLALKVLKDIERQVNIEAEMLGLQPQLPVTGPHNVRGIEINEYAAELARMTIWIGELQWRKQNGYGWKLNPVLEPLDQIECRDALLSESSGHVAPAQWPEPPRVSWRPVGVSQTEAVC
ncbi:class I SAM-dependent DNA methyltransferase [Ramlibacter albus]|uniref:site-specific DNA-methyltransferase (adenine-specific) n=1 Tax=Ramlibacter albus TaxID=2079448 RepID=A0A923M673_9BURK|nr:class I SAM-dependent DNA methyltransferase [Ramlibacter albus]MBC5764583.1 class I SAM-dependent DNA methyltransferase [Ramlibacter albus]